MNKAKAYKSALLDQMFDEIPEQEFKKTEQRMRLAIKIADALKTNGFTKKQLADLMDQHPSVITKWLSGTHNFTVDTLFDLERVLNIELVSLCSPQKSTQIKYKTVMVYQQNPSYENLSDLIGSSNLFSSFSAENLNVKIN